MAYTFNPDDVLSFAYSIGSDVKEKGGEIQFKLCPYCNGGDHHDKETFSVNAETGAFNCFRSSCGKTGHFVELCRDFNYLLPDMTAKKQYKEYPQAEITIRPAAAAWLESKRHISKTISDRYRITTWESNSNVIVFPFYDTDGKLVGAKYRNTKFKKGVGKNKEWSDKGSKPVLFGMNQCSDFDRLVITEGQIDSLSVAESGIENAVSVPTGSRGFTWVENCYDFVDRFKEIVVFGDCEKGKISLVDDMCKRFPKKTIKVVRMVDYLGEKDANDILIKYGKDAIRKCVEQAEVKKIEAVKNISDVVKPDTTNDKPVNLGIWDIDAALCGGMHQGQLVLLTGKCGEGKSTFASQVVANVVEQGLKCFVYSGELPDYQFKEWLYYQIAGRDRVSATMNQYGYYDVTISESDTALIDNWLSEKIYIYDNNYINEVDENNSLLDIAEQVICRYGVQFILIDNLMTALDDDMSIDLYRSQSNFIKRLKSIAQRLDVIIMLICHPKKEKEELGTDSVSGSANIGNLADTVITYCRNDGDNRDKYQSLIGITKNRKSGKRLTAAARVPVKYGETTKRIVSDKDDGRKVYSAFKTETSVQNGLPEEPPF